MTIISFVALVLELFAIVPQLCTGLNLNAEEGTFAIGAHCIYTEELLKRIAD